MHFSPLNRSGNKAGRLMLVAGLHVVLGALLVHGMQSKTFTLSTSQPSIVMIDPVTPRPVEPPPPSRPADLPPLSVPVVETAALPPDQPDVVRASTEADVSPPPAIAGREGPPAPPAEPAAPPARPADRMHTAVLADANACALPAYPARSARNGDTGTTILALLVGADGRVGSARVERSSGFRELDRAAIDALSLCRFKPATSNGVPEAGWARMGYAWTLD